MGKPDLPGIGFGRETAKFFSHHATPDYTVQLPDPALVHFPSVVDSVSLPASVRGYPSFIVIGSGKITSYDTPGHDDDGGSGSPAVADHVSDYLLIV